MIAIWFFVKKFAPYLIAFAVLAGVLGAVHRHGTLTERRTLTAEYEANISKLRADADKQHDADVQAARVIEHQAAQAVATIETKYLLDTKNEKSRTDSVIADLRSGAVKLRSRFTCAPNPGSVSGATASTAGNNDGVQGGLQEPDAEFFIQLAASADEVAHTLEACQSLVMADRVK